MPAGTLRRLLPPERIFAQVSPNVQPQLLFQIFSEGREYRIYTNGRVDGFGERPLVSNYYPLLEATGLASLRRQLQAAHPSAEAEHKELHHSPAQDG